MSDRFPLANGFVISCPVSAVGNSPVRDIRKRGNIPLVLQEDVVVELTRNDMLESWRTTCALGQRKADQMIQSAADRISNALEDEDSYDIAALATDMAAFFLLAVRQGGLDVKRATRYCSMTWHSLAANHLHVREY